MIEGHEKFRMQDENKKHDFFVEVNWEPNNPEINNCRILKVSFPNGDVAYIPKERLMAMLFAIGAPDEQRQMIPQKLRRVRWYETTVGVKATKDISKGEMINFPIKLSLPAQEEEVIGPAAAQRSSGLYVPK